jgi:hypothetical protein
VALGLRRSISWLLDPAAERTTDSARKYGYWNGQMMLQEHHPAIRHFHTWEDKQVLDFLQVAFRVASVG